MMQCVNNRVGTPPPTAGRRDTRHCFEAEGTAPITAGHESTAGAIEELEKVQCG